MAEKFDAVVVGSGPNGLAAAITLARAGCSVMVLEANDSIGGGARSAELTLPGFIHDVCSAVHPLAVASPFFSSLPLENFGLEWIQPEIPLAHPLPDDEAVVLYRQLDATEDSLGEDAATYRGLMQPLVRDWPHLVTEFLQPMLHLPRHPFALARFGWSALQPATSFLRKRFKTARARALLAGGAAHSFLPLETRGPIAFGLILAATAHVSGWPVARGGSQTLAAALANYLRSLGGVIETNRPVESLEDLPKSRVRLLDITAWQLVSLAGNRLPGRYRKKLERFRHAPGVFKIDYALSQPVPWGNPLCRRAGTVHVGGTFEEIAQAEREVSEGKCPEHPFVLVAQQSVFDQTRAPANHHTLWAYCHVPFGSTVDMSAKIEAQIERFAPGFRDCVVARHSSNSVDLARKNRNLAGGDISGGAADLWQLLNRPVLSMTPYRTPLPGAYLCSSSTPPGGGVHGMCGFHAARAALRDCFGK